MMKAKRILFLCTGNYYRSRFAELLFNHLAPQHELPWVASSRGLALELGSSNVGPIAIDTLKGLAARGVVLGREARFPLPLIEDDLASFDHIVALKRAEHLPLMARNFPRWVEHVEFWHVHDRDFALPEETLAHIEGNVIELVARLRANVPASSVARRRG